MRVRSIAALTVLGLLFAAVSAMAQVVVNPKIVQFVPSADHSAINPLDGLPVVLRYEVRFYLPTNLTTAIVTQDLGKPAIGTDGTIQGAITAATAAATVTAAKNTKLQARVAAVGQYGNEGLSEPTDLTADPFGFVGPPGTATGVVIKK